MGNKKGGNDEAKQARKDEEARQARIRAGTARVNSIFDGGNVATGALDAGATFDPNATYYNPDGTVYSGGSGGFGKAAKAGQLFSGVTPETGFNDDFFNGLKQSYLDYADPQLEDQYNDANKQLTFSLARSGNLDSSARAEKEADLGKLYDTQKRAVADKALGYETSSRNAVEDARANLLSTLNATGDQQGAVNSALARASALSQPPAYDPLGQLFVDFTNGLGVQAAQERSYAAGGPTPRYDTGLFGNTGRVSVRS